MYQQNYFSRTAGNEARMGAFYTDLSHCESIGEMFKFPREEVSALEPSIGDGSAILTVTDAENNPQVRIFGVELNDEVVAETKQNPLMEEVLKGDFLEGVSIKKGSFSFCFSNPPYMDDCEEKDRMEYQFLMKITELMKLGGILVWVVPETQFKEWKHFRHICNNFEILTVYKFRESEYKKFKQVVAVLRRKKKGILLKQQVEEKLSLYENLSELPIHPEERFEVLPSASEEVNPFASKIFDEYKAYEFLDAKLNTIDFADITSVVGEAITQKKFVGGEVGRPPIPPKKDTLYLMATSGVGQGITGSIETGDYHLQRGVAEVVEETMVEGDEEGSGSSKDQVLRVTSRTKITMTIVEPDGRITTLE